MVQQGGTSSPTQLTHVNAAGKASMVDVGEVCINLLIKLRQMMASHFRVSTSINREMLLSPLSSACNAHPREGASVIAIQYRE